MTDRDLVVNRVPGSLRRAIAQRTGRLIVMHEVAHPNGDVFAYTGSGPLSYDGHIWAGVGDLLAITGLGFSRRTEVRTPKLILAGVTTDQLQFINDKVRGRKAVVSLAALKPTSKEVDGKPYPICTAICDAQAHIIDKDRTATIELALRQPLFVLDRAVNLRWTPEWFKATFGKEITGADDLPGVAPREVSWNPPDT